MLFYSFAMSIDYKNPLESLMKKIKINCEFFSQPMRKD